MAVNKVEIDGEVKLDLTQDTVTEDTLLQGVTAHDAAGNPVEGKVLTTPVPKTSNLLKGDGNGGVSAATPGTDYVAEKELPTPLDPDDTGKYLRWFSSGWVLSTLDTNVKVVALFENDGDIYASDIPSDLQQYVYSGTPIIAHLNSEPYLLTSLSNESATFTRVVGRTIETITVSSDAMGVRSTAELQTVSSKSLIDAPNQVNLADNIEYYLTNVGTVTFAFPAATKFECWLRITTVASGTVSITFPATVKYIGEAPTFGAGETWELSVKDGVVIAMKETA